MRSDDAPLACTRSVSLKASYPGMQFTAISAEDIQADGFNEAVQAFAASTARRILHLNDDAEGSLCSFESFFRDHGWDCPLRKQISAAAKRGFPSAPTPVLALLALEAATGALMGVQDLHGVSSGVQIDVLGAPETFIGMRGKTIPCRSGEIVVRDEKGIVASLFQGPDERTAVRPESRGLLFYVFDTGAGLGPYHHAVADTVASLVSPHAERFHIIRAM
jgi:hypothetical protein